jgi:hypothetical protein
MSGQDRAVPDILSDMPDSDPTPDSISKIAAGVEALNAAFRPLLKQLSHDLEPAVILSESAVFGE